MQHSQQVVNPFGITVFGSSIVRIQPDVAVISCAVIKTKPHPRDAFQEVRETAQAVQKFLSEAQINDAGSSRITLEEAHVYGGPGESKFLGYRAQVTFRIILKDLNRVEAVLTGLVDAGIQRIQSVSFQSTQLKEIRAEARRQAIRAAYEKAQIYCETAGVTLGSVLHIEDVNPDELRGHEGHGRTPDVSLNDEGALKAFDPGSITIGGAVLVAYSIREHQPKNP